MAGAWSASIEDLKALTAFLEGLTELSNRTGVMACVYNGVEVDVDGTVLRINSTRTEDGVVSYYVDEHGN